MTRANEADPPLWGLLERTHFCIVHKVTKPNGSKKTEFQSIRPFKILGFATWPLVDVKMSAMALDSDFWAMVLRCAPFLDQLDPGYLEFQARHAAQ